MEFRILGSLEAISDARPVPLGGPRQRALLAYLLLRPNEVVSRDRLADALWPGSTPDASARSLYVAVSSLRKALGPAGAGLLVTRPPGYALSVDPAQIDAVRFERLFRGANEALDAGEAETASDLLVEALALWRGPALADVALEEFAHAEAARLDELRARAVEHGLQAALELGRHAEVVPQLEAVVAEHPLRERPRAQLMLALYRSGRQAEALDVYRRTRGLLSDELGIEPGPELRQLEQAILRQDASLAAPRAAMPVRLPAPPTPLLGRDGAVAEVCALLEQDGVRLVTLTGPGGVGKSRLGLAAAARLAPWFRDGVYFVGLAAVTDPELIPSAIIQAVDSTETGETAERAVERWAAGRSVLLLLDNLEQLPGAAPFLGRLLAAAPGLKLLATSRASLHVSGERELPVAPLEEGPAVELFVERARAVKPTFAPDPALAEICARLDGLPLAIELAAARSRLLEPRALLERLERRLPLLTDGPRDAPERHRTLAATIEWSHALLEPAEQRAFARLAVFAGGCSLAAAEDICEAGLDVLGSFVSKSLLREEPGRFSTLETIREYALERLAGSGEEDAARRRHLTHYLGLAEEAEPLLWGSEQALGFGLLELEHDNLRAALGFALEHDRDAALALCVALRRFWHIHGHLAEGRRALEAALEGTEGASRERAAALNSLGVIAGEQGEIETSWEYLGRSLELSRALGDAERIGSALGNLGNVAVFRGDYERGIELYEEAAAIWSGLAHVRGLAMVRENQGLAELYRGANARAVELLEESVRLAREAGEVRQVAASLRSLASALVGSGDPGRTRALIEEALRLACDVGEPQTVAECLDCVGALALAEEDPAAAAALWGASEALRTTTGARRPPDEERVVGERVAILRERLGEDGFAEASERGRGLDLEAAAALGLASSRT